MARMVSHYRQEMRLFDRKGRVIWAVLLGAALLYLPTVLTTRTLFGVGLSDVQLLGIGLAQVNFALIAVMAAVALNLLIGYTGLISIGHAAFFAVGAIVASVLRDPAIPFVVVLAVAGVVGGLVGVLVGLPALRLRGLYLLLSTLALHYIAIWAVLTYQTDNFGPAGMSYTTPSLFGLPIVDDQDWYFLLLAGTVIVMLLSRNLLHMRQGRAMVAIRDHDVAASSLGINVGLQRVKTFAMTSVITSIVGVLYVHYLTVVNSEAFTLEFVIGYFAIIIIGGMGSLLGAVLGVLVWQMLPQILQTLSQTVDPSTPVFGDLFGRYQGQVVLLLLGLLVIVIMLFKPAGLSGLWEAIKRGVLRWPYSR